MAGTPSEPRPPSEPEFFADLHLDQVVASLTTGREEYELAQLFYQALHDLGAVRYRHEALRDLEDETLLETVRAFTAAMHRMREQLSLLDRLYYGRQKQRWFLDAVATYCEAVGSILKQLVALELRSRGLRWLARLRRFLRAIPTGSPRLLSETQRVTEGLTAVNYTVQIKGSRVRVDYIRRRTGHEPGGGANLRQVPAAKRSTIIDVKFQEHAGMNHVEAQVLDLVAKLHLKPFTDLDGLLRSQSRLRRRDNRPVRS